MPLRYWIFIAFTLSLTALIGYGTFNTARLLRAWRPPYNLLLSPPENMARIALIALCVVAGLLSGLPAEQLGWVAPAVGWQLLWGGLLGVGVALFFHVSTRWLLAKTGQRFYSSTIIEHLLPHSRREYWLVALAMVGVVVLEELLFRSLLVGGLSPLLSPWILVLVAGAVFGAMHMPQGPWGIAGASMAGILFGSLFLWAGSLLTPLVAHYVANFIQIHQAVRTQGYAADSSSAAGGPGGLS